MLISVVVPTHNRSDLLPRAIRSVLEQTDVHLECIVVDDASADDTPEVVRQCHDTRLVYLRHESNRGASATRNTGISHARGDLIAFLDDDDEWLLGKLEKQVALMEASPEQVGVVSCMHYASNPGCNRSVEVNDPATFIGNIYLKLLRGSCPEIMSSVLVKREVFNTCGLLDETLRSYTDYDLWLRVSQRYLFACVPEPLTVVYQHQGTRLSQDLAPRKAALEQVLFKWGVEVRKHYGERGYHQLERHLLTPIYVNAILHSAQTGELRLASRCLLEVIWLQPARPRLYGWLMFRLVRAIWNRARSPRVVDT